MSPLVIYCDASVPHHLNPDPEAFGGWGAVFVRDGEVLGEVNGPLGRVSSTDAEMQAAREAFKVALRRDLVVRGGTVLIASDCLAVVDRTAPGIFCIARRSGVELVTVKVKAHNINDEADPHAIHNNRADRLARLARGRP